MRRMILMLIGAAMLAAPGPVVAHTSVKSVSIKAGARLAAAPPNITVTYGKPVGVGSAQLLNGAGGNVPLNWTPPRAVSTSFTIPLPKLAPGSYRLNWRIMSDDGHAMTSGVSFTVTGPAGR